MRLGFAGICLLFATIILGQETDDLYSSESSRKFANYLFIKGDLQFAADEYARLLYLNPADDGTLVRLSSIYRRLEQVDQARSLFQDYRAGQIFGSPTLEKEFISTLLFASDRSAFSDALNQCVTLTDEESIRISVEQALLDRDWSTALDRLTSAPASRWKDVYVEKSSTALAFRPKKPWLASTMSVFLPGSGKIYAKNTKEGITSFLFVAALGYQSYRAFDQRGTKSVGGWIYGTLGLGFYLGNIYGAQQSAKNYNKRKRSEIHSEVDHIIYRRHQ